MKPHSPDEPFPGPRPFIETEAGIFFGRDAEINDLSDLICTYPFVLLYSQSGAGKSSLIQAGLIPSLRKKGSFIFPTARVGSSESDSSVPQSVFVHRVMQSLSGKMTPRDTNISDAVQHHIEANQETHQQYVLIIDQAEELFTTLPEKWNEREALFRELGIALSTNNKFRVLMVMREEYLGDVETFADCTPYALNIRYRLERLRREDASEAVTRPLSIFGWMIGESSLDHLLNNLQTIRVIRAGRAIDAPGEYIEPVHLQVVCRDLWQKRPTESQANILSVPTEIDHLDDSLVGFYNTAVSHAADRTKTKEALIRTWFQEELITPRGTRKVAFKGEQETGDLPNGVVEELEREHLIRSEPRAGGEVCELTHDRMIAPITKANHAWKMLRRRRRVPVYALVGILIAIAMAFGVHPLKNWWTAQQASNRHKQADEEQRNADHAFYAEKNPLEAKVQYDQALRDFQMIPNSSSNPDQTITTSPSASAVNYGAIAYINERLAEICAVARHEGGCLPASSYLSRAIDADNHLDLPLRKADDTLALADYEFRVGNTRQAEQLYIQVVTLVNVAREREISQSRYRVVGGETFQKESSAMTGLGLIQLRRGDWKGAREKFGQGMATLKRHDEMREWAILIEDLGAAQIQAGLYHSAETTYGQLMYSNRFKGPMKIDDLVPLLRGWGLAKILTAKPAAVYEGSIAIQKAYNTLEIKRNGIGIGDEVDEAERSEMIQAEQYEQGFNCLAIAKVRLDPASRTPKSWMEALNKAQEARDIFNYYGDKVDENLATLKIAQIQQLSADPSQSNKAKADEEAVLKLLEQEEVYVSASEGIDPSLLAASHNSLSK
jgi:hypothetical protein